MDREPAANLQAPQQRERVLLEGRIAILYELSHHYLFLPFAALSMAAALMEPHPALLRAAAPLVLLIAVTVAGNRLKEAYDRRDPSRDDPALWGRRYTILSALAGGVWGLGALLWFVPDSFPAQAYLVLAFLGMSAAEFVARAAYRPAYLAHASASLLPLAALLVLEDGPFQTLAAILILFFAGVLYSYSGTVTQLLQQSILLRHDHQELIKRLGEEKDTAEASRDHARQSERTKSHFIAQVSHELRTPLNAILGMAQLLERSDLEKAQREHVKVLLEAGRGLKTLLDDVIALAGHDGEPLTPPAEGCDASQAARTVARLLQPNAWEKRLRLSLNIANGLPRVAADARLLRRVLLKVVGNAIKFTERGSIEIALDSFEEESGKRMVRFTVIDTGPGIPQHVLSTIFQPFARTDDSYAARHTGAGIGLPVAKRLVESAGGHIGVESEPGMGARFFITLPAATVSSIEDNPLNERVPPPSGLSLLAYIPDRTIRTAIERMLTPFGNKFAVADTLAQAVTLSVRGGFTLLLAEAEAADALAAAPGQRTPILAIATADKRSPDGADNLLRWPASADRLYAAIAAMIANTDSVASYAEADDGDDGGIDIKAMAELEKSLGFKTLLDILQSYLHTAEDLATALAAATEKEDWSLASRLAQDFAGAAGGLGLGALMSAARALAQEARDGSEQSSLATATAGVLTQHQRVRDALRRLYPDLSV